MATYFDVTRTYLYWHDRQPTGIQRAVYGLCEAARAYGVTAVVFHPGHERFYGIAHLSHSPRLFQPAPDDLQARWDTLYRRFPKVVQTLCDPIRDFVFFKTGYWKQRLSGRLAALEGDKMPVEFEAEDRIFLLDLNTSIPSYVPAIRRVKQAHKDLEIIAFVHDIFPLRNPAFSGRQFRREFEKWWTCMEAIADRFLTSSHEVARSVSSRVRDKPVRPIAFGGVIASRPRAAAAVGPDHEGWILSVGMHEARKNHTFQLEALEPLWRSGQLTVPLMLAGACAAATSVIEKKIQSSAVLQRHVHLLGAVSDDTLWELYAGARLYILSSVYEGFGLTISEAMQCDCPCFVARAGALPEVGGDCVEYFDLDDPAQLRSLVGRFFSDPRFEREMRQRTQRFEPQTWTQAVEDMLRDA